jgi:hypothetical protein
MKLKKSSWWAREFINSRNEWIDHLVENKRIRTLIYGLN